MYKPKLPPEPQKPKKTDKTTVVAKFICGTSDRVHYFPGWGGDEDQDEELEESKEKQINPKSRHRIRMIDVLEKLPPDVAIEDVYVTASFSDDYLNLEVCYDQRVNLYDKQVKEYMREMEKWKIKKEQYDKDIVRYEDELKKELASLKR
jgi:hypothetical protein